MFPEFFCPGRFIGRSEGQPENQHLSMCAGTRTAGRCFGQIQRLSFLQYGFFKIRSL